MSCDICLGKTYTDKFINDDGSVTLYMCACTLDATKLKKLVDSIPDGEELSIRIDK